MGLSTYRPTPEEKETIVITTEADDYYSVYTYNYKLKQRLKRLSIRHPEICQLIGSDSTGAYTYHVDKAYLVIGLQMPARERYDVQ